MTISFISILSLVKYIFQCMTNDMSICLYVYILINACSIMSCFIPQPMNVVTGWIFRLHWTIVGLIKHGKCQAMLHQLKCDWVDNSMFWWVLISPQNRQQLNEESIPYYCGSANNQCYCRSPVAGYSVFSVFEGARH